MGRKRAIRGPSTNSKPDQSYASRLRGAKNATPTDRAWLAHHDAVARASRAHKPAPAPVQAPVSAPVASDAPVMQGAPPAPAPVAPVAATGGGSASPISSPVVTPTPLPAPIAASSHAPPPLDLRGIQSGERPRLPGQGCGDPRCAECSDANRARCPVTNKPYPVEISATSAKYMAGTLMGGIGMGIGLGFGTSVDPVTDVERKEMSEGLKELSTTVDFNIVARWLPVLTIVSVWVAYTIKRFNQARYRAAVRKQLAAQSAAARAAQQQPLNDPDTATPS